MPELVWKDKARPSTDRRSNQECERASGDTMGHWRLVTEEYYPPDGADAVALPMPGECWHNRLIRGDRRAASVALLPEFRASVDLIYIDPPFMTGRTFSKDGQLAYQDTWRNDLDTYLQWLYETLVYLHDLLAVDGSLYIHLDWRTSHYAKIMLDEIFEAGSHLDGVGFKNEIIWHYQSGGSSQRSFARKHDTLLLYTKSAHYCFHGERVGERRGARRRNHMRKEIGEDGRVSWSISSAGRVYTYDEDTRMAPSDVWSDISHLHQRDPERTGYATQKPLALLERIILASSEEGDLVLDCFCGSGVMPVAAERLGRRWIACDKSDLAMTTTRARLLAESRRRPFVVQHVEAAG